jgi:hypothetical protein
VDVKRTLWLERRLRLRGVDRRCLGEGHRAIKCETAAGKAHLEGIPELAEAVDADEDSAVLEADLHVLAGRAGGVEHRQIGVVAFEQVHREWRALLGATRRAPDCLQNHFADGLADIAYHSSTSESGAVSPQYGQAKSETPTSLGMS